MSELLDKMFCKPEIDQVINKITIEENNIKPLLNKAMFYESLLYKKIPELYKYPYSIIQEHPCFENISICSTSKVNAKKLYIILTEGLMNIILKIDSIEGYWNKETRLFRKNTILRIQKIIDHIERIRILMRTSF